MRRAHCLTLGLAAVALATGLADVAAAQTTSASAPPRYLNWAGRPEAALPPEPAAISARPDAAARRPNRVIPHGGSDQPAVASPPVASEAPRRTLTPANAWLHPAPAPASVPTPMPAPVTPQPAPSARATPDYLPDQGGRGQPTPAEVAFAAPQPVAPVAGPDVDPMAPRRDAPIFHMQRTPPSAPAPAQTEPAPQGQAEAAPTAAEPRRVAMVTANPDDRPTVQGSRYYSVHRQNGRTPDAVALPEPTYVDALAISAPVTIASQDLAQPAEAPTLIRDAQGRVRAQPAAPEGDYQ